MRNSLTIVCAGLLSACSAGPDYSRPGLPHTAEQRFVNNNAQVISASVPDKWWLIYNDPALNMLIARTLHANTDLRMATANLERARAFLGETGNARFPSTQLSSGITRGDSTTADGNGSALAEQQWTRYGGFTMAWEIDLAGRVRRSIEAAEADLQAQQAAREAVQIAVVAETVRQYTLACSLTQSVADARGSLSVARESHALTEAMAREGAASRFDIERSSVSIGNIEARLSQLESRRQSTLLALAAVTGNTPSAIPEQAVHCQRVPELISAIPVGDGAGLLRCRPDVKEAERKLAANTARVGIATAELYPRITLGGSVNFMRNRELGTDDGWSAGIGPFLSWSVPNVGTARARIAQAEAEVRASLARFDGVVLIALKEAEQALANVQGETQRYNALKRVQDSAQKAWMIADERYHNGSISALEMLDVQKDYFSARSALSESEANLAAARVDLFKALGGSWEKGSNVV